MLPGGESSPAGPSPLKLLARGASVALAIKLGEAAANYLEPVCLARWMGAAEYGRFEFAIAWSGALALLAGMGLPNAVLRFVPQYAAQERWDRLRGVLQASERATLAASAGVVAVGAAALAVGVAGRPVEPRVLTAAVLGLALVPMQALVALRREVVRGFSHIGLAYGPSLVVLPLAIAGGAFLWRQTLEPRLGLPLTGAAGLAIALVAMGTVLAAQQWRFRRKLPPALVEVRSHWAARALDRRELLGVALSLLFVDGAFLVLNQTDTLAIGALLGDRDVGYYAAALKTARWVSLSLASANAIAAPLFSQLYARGDRAGMQALLSAAAGWIFLPAVAIALGLAVLAEPVLGLFGPDFGAARGALWALAAGQLANAGAGSVGYLMMMTGNHRTCARVVAVCAAVNLALNLLLIPRWGITGAAIATALSMALWNFWLYRQVVRRLGLRPAAIAIWAARGRGTDAP